jgi:hypothetical protein
VQSLTGNAVTLFAVSSDLIIDVKQRIEKSTGISPGRQQLKQPGVGIVLQDNKTLAEHGIIFSSTLQLTVVGTSTPPLTPSVQTVTKPAAAEAPQINIADITEIVYFASSSIKVGLYIFPISLLVLIFLFYFQCLCTDYSCFRARTFCKVKKDLRKRSCVVNIHSLVGRIARLNILLIR